MSREGLKIVLKVKSELLAFVFSFGSKQTVKLFFERTVQLLIQHSLKTKS